MLAQTFCGGKNMNFDQMLHIVTVSNEMSITKAAEKLFISTSGLSQSITQLENELGIKIFNRTKKSITPTFEGKIVISEANNILKSINSMNNKINIYKNKNEKHLDIVFTTGISNLLLDTLHNYKSKNKDISFDMIEKDFTEVIEFFIKENYDFAITYSPLESFNKLKNIGYKLLLRSSFCVGAGKKSPFYSLEYITPSELNNTKILWDKRSHFNLLSKLFNLTSDQMFLHAYSERFLIQMAKESDAIFIMPEIALINYEMVLEGDIKFIPIKENNQMIGLDFWLIYFETRGLSNLATEIIKNFYEYIDNVVKKNENLKGVELFPIKWDTD